MEQTDSDRIQSGSDVTSLEELREQIKALAQQRNRITIGDVMDVIGRRSFGPILVVAGLIMLAPVIGDIPGVPVLMGILVILTAGQMLFRRDDHFWLPQWLLRRSADQKKLLKGLKWLGPVTRVLDRISKPRLHPVIRNAGVYAIAIGSIAVAVATPVMEVVPFSANLAGIAVTAFGLALVAHDGLLALLALAMTLGSYGLLVYKLI